MENQAFETDKYGWHNFVGERVLVKMSKYATERVDRIVTGYKIGIYSGFVEFDNDGNWYEQNSIIPEMIWKSERYPHAWTW